jgi:hypothetical protein
MQSAPPVLVAMTTKQSNNLTLFDKLSRLTFTQVSKLLGPGGKQLIQGAGAREIDISQDVELQRDTFRLRLGASTVTIALHAASRDRIDWACDSCDVPCEHVGAAFSLILEEKMALGLYRRHRRSEFQ